MVAHGMEMNGIDLQKAMEKPVEVAKEYPVTSMMVLFGVGVGVGVLLAQACAANLPSMHSETMSEKLSRQIYDAVTNAIPDSVRKQFHV